MRYLKYLTEDVVSKALGLPEPKVGQDYPSEKFQIMICSDCSTDKTTEIIQSFKDDRIVHIIPERDDLGIGGCWNRAVEDERCGKFAVQLKGHSFRIDVTVPDKILCFIQGVLHLPGNELEHFIP